MRTEKRHGYRNGCRHRSLTRLFERVNDTPRGALSKTPRPGVVRIFPNDAAGYPPKWEAVLLKQDEHWQLEGLRMC